MLYDVEEVIPKLNKKKVAVTIIVAVLVVCFFVFLGIYFAKLHKNNKDNNIVNKVSNSYVESKIKHIARVDFKPVYTDVGKELMKNIYHSDEKVVYLTFDDGPSKTVTPLILDLLKQENIKATFFILGARAKSNPNIIKREYEEGHYIANHGYSHVYGNIYANPQAVLDEYNKTKEVVQNILGINYDGHLFRFPGGSTGGKYKSIKSEAKKLLNENNVAYIDWNALSSDAAGAKTKEAIIQNIKDTVGTKKSVVILMHDSGDKILTYETLQEVINYLREQGYIFKNFYSIIK